MKLTITKSKNATLYYAKKSYRTAEGKSPTRSVERLGTENEVINVGELSRGAESFIKGLNNVNVGREGKNMYFCPTFGVHPRVKKGKLIKAITRLSSV